MDSFGRAAEQSGCGAAAAGVRRLHLLFAGQVQGVGFRWTARDVADAVGATGWVRNERDGTVSMELQGTDAQIAEFFGRFQRAYATYPISYTIEERRTVPRVDGEDGFVVRF